MTLNETLTVGQKPVGQKLNVVFNQQRAALLVRNPISPINTNLYTLLLLVRNLLVRNPYLLDQLRFTGFSAHLGTCRLLFVCWSVTPPLGGVTAHSNSSGNVLTEMPTETSSEASVSFSLVRRVNS